MHELLASDTFGVRIRGVDVSKPLAPDLLAEINAAVDRYSFVCFPEQAMDDDRQLALTRQLGSPEPSHTSVGKTEYFGTIGNVQQDGTVLGNSHKKTIFLTGNNMWHSDASFKPVPAFLSIMCAYETPSGRYHDVRIPARRLRTPRRRERPNSSR